MSGAGTPAPPGLNLLPNNGIYPAGGPTPSMSYSCNIYNVSAAGAHRTAILSIPQMRHKCVNAGFDAIFYAFRVIASMEKCCYKLTGAIKRPLKRDVNMRRAMKRAAADRVTRILQ